MIQGGVLMCRVVLDMQGELFTEAITKALKDSHLGFLVYTSAGPQETVSLCRSCRANVLVMEVNRTKAWSLDERIRILTDLKHNNSTKGCKTLLLVDEKVDDLLAADVRQAVKDQLADNFVYTSVSPAYLAGLIDTLQGIR